MELFLGPFHSHFLLCNDGSKPKFGAEREFRTVLENKLANLAKEATNMDESKLVLN